MKMIILATSVDSLIMLPANVAPDACSRGSTTEFHDGV
jgi:hypothetical protein